MTESAFNWLVSVATFVCSVLMFVLCVVLTLYIALMEMRRASMSLS